MKNLRINFTHAVSGRLRLNLLDKEPELICRGFETGQDNQFILPLEGLSPGKWKLTLEWEHEERPYRHTQEFTVGESEDLFKTNRYAEASLYHSKHPLYCMNR